MVCPNTIVKALRNKRTRQGKEHNLHVKCVMRLQLSFSIFYLGFLTSNWACIPLYGEFPSAYAQWAFSQNKCSPFAHGVILEHAVAAQTRNVKNPIPLTSKQDLPLATLQQLKIRGKQQRRLPLLTVVQGKTAQSHDVLGFIITSSK